MTDKYMYTFTVFTPTFNRAYTLPIVYESLKKQTFRDFEWLIVDDGSTDNTRDLVETWQKEAKFQIRYFWQKNGGKHRARNFGVSQAQGAFFLPRTVMMKLFLMCLRNFITTGMGYQKIKEVNLLGLLVCV